MAVSLRALSDQFEAGYVPPRCPHVLLSAATPAAPTSEVAALCNWPVFRAPQTTLTNYPVARFWDQLPAARKPSAAAARTPVLTRFGPVDNGITPTAASQSIIQHASRTDWGPTGLLRFYTRRVAPFVLCPVHLTAGTLPSAATDYHSTSARAPLQSGRKMSAETPARLAFSALI